MSIEKQLQQIFNVIIDEIKINKEFATSIEKILGKEEISVNDKVETKTKKRGRQPAVFNPNVIGKKGEETLKKELEKLEVSQLKDIISQYSMDPSKMTSRLRSKAKLMNHIIEVSLTRLKKGDAFRE